LQADDPVIVAPGAPLAATAQTIQPTPIHVMSLHAQLSPEAAAQLVIQRRNSTVSSILISILAIVLIGLIMAFILLPSLFIGPDTRVIYNPRKEDPPEHKLKEVNTKVQRNPSAPSSARTYVFAVNIPSPTPIPVPDVRNPNPSDTFGSGDDFGKGWGGPGDGPGIFTNIPTDMSKRCSPEDRLARLRESGGNDQCEEAVMASLRWMQSTQNKDGSWAGRKVAYTGLALLAYLGHCETPHSPEFGDTVISAMTYLINVNVKNNGKMADNLGDKHWPYEHAIASYALAESYTFCKEFNIPITNLDTATQNAIQWIIDNQHTSGGWDYNYDESSGRGGDLSIAAWHMQALKAAKHTGLDFRNFRSCVTKGLKYVEARQDSNGGFGYSGTKPVGGDHYTLTGAGSLCIQQHKGASNSIARKGIKYIDKEAEFSWKDGPANLYEHYYNAQAMINHGGESWKKYNALFRDEILNAQKQDGSWGQPKGGGPGTSGPAIYHTALSTLMLEVYYRFLPGTGENS
jgi:hypothetical protein